MNKKLALALSICGLAILFRGGRAAHAEESSLFQCAHCAVLHSLQNEGGRAASARRYAPDRVVDIRHLKLEITPDFSEQTIAGAATLTFQPIAEDVLQLRLHAVELDVQAVESSHALRGYTMGEGWLTLTFQEPLQKGSETTLTVRYAARPRDGLFFRTPTGGYRDEDTQLWTQGEPESHRHWFPSHDYPNEKFTTELICHVPEGMVALSNGRLVRESKDESSGLTTFHWLQDKVHVNYLVSLVAGKFAKLEETLREGIPIAIYVPPSEAAQAANSFVDTKKILQFFEEEIGVPYPWDKYFNVCAMDYMFGGMENTSITTLTVNTLFTDAHENLRSSRGLDAHEVAHQWFGDLVTCKDWSHLWLNEGFATYYSLLYDREAEGDDFFKWKLYENAETIFRNREDITPIVFKGYEKPMDQFSFRAYPKGGWVLHMLRAELGEDLFRQCVKTYLERHQYETVVSADLLAVFEELSGRSLDQFFDQWIFLSGYPEVEVTYAWNEVTRQAKLSVKQIQETSEARPVFKFPLPVRFTNSGGTTDITLQIDEVEEDFYLPLGTAPEIVRFDPEVTVLAKVNFKPERSMLLAQLRNPEDAMGRLMAVAQLPDRLGKDAVEPLKEVLNQDPFVAVRLDAARALGRMRSPEALAVLLDASSQEDARARQAVVRAVDSFYGEEAYAALRRVADGEANPDIRTIAIRGLGKYSKPELRSFLLEQLQSDSYRHALADAAIDAMRSQDDPFYVQPLLRELRRSSERFTSGGFSRALGTLAHLARREEDRAGVRAYLVDRLDDPKPRIVRSAMAALGELGDTRALPILQTFVSADAESTNGREAQVAINRLREREKTGVPEEVGQLRQELQDLRRQLQGVTDDMKALRDQFKAGMEALHAEEKTGN